MAGRTVNTQYCAVVVVDLCGAAPAIKVAYALTNCFCHGKVRICHDRDADRTTPLLPRSLPVSGVVSARVHLVCKPLFSACKRNCMHIVGMLSKGLKFSATCLEDPAPSCFCPLFVLQSMQEGSKQGPAAVIVVVKDQVTAFINEKMPRVADRLGLDQAAARRLLGKATAAGFMQELVNRPAIDGFADKLQQASMDDARWQSPEACYSGVSAMLPQRRISNTPSNQSTLEDLAHGPDVDVLEAAYNAARASPQTCCRLLGTVLVEFILFGQ